jgi:hypothetical protein
MGKLVQPLKKGCIKNLVTVASSNLNVALEDSAIRQMAPRTPQRGFKSLATRVARAEHSGPGAAIHTMASPAVHTSSLPRKAALRSEAPMTAMMTTHFLVRKGAQGLLGDFEA